VISCDVSGERRVKRILAVAALMLGCFTAKAEKIGSVSTTFVLVGANDKIVVDVFDDPKVSGVACYLSHAEKGGVSGMLGFAEDSSDASVACRQIAAISFTSKLPEQEEVFSEKSSFLFKHLRVVRMIDKKRNTLVYMAYSDKVVDGSPKNSVTAVPVPLNLVIPVK
jgi:CreA protein